MNATHQHHDHSDGHHHGQAGSRAELTASADKVLDPVCGMRIAPNEARSAMHNGQKYFFCSDGCKAKFMGIQANISSRKYRRR